MGRNKNTTKAITVAPDLTAIERTLMTGDLSGLTPDQRLHYYKSVCDSLGLNPLTRPFAYINLNGKLTLYALKDCTEQLRKVHNVTVTIKAREISDGCYVVTANATLQNGRGDESIGAVSIEGLKGEARSNAYMKAETKAKRRVTLSICGLGMLDESEADSITGAEIIERNVRDATTNAQHKNRGDATWDTKEMATAISSQSNAAPTVQPAGAADKENITADNYKELVVHIGKANGEMLGRKVGDLHPNIIEWLYTKWRNKLTPLSSEADLRLKTAVEFAHQAASAAPQTAPDEPQATPPTLPGGVTKDAIIANLRERCADLVLTEEQVCEYLSKYKVLDNAKALLEVSEDQLRYIEQNWDTVKSLIEADVKPKAIEGKKKWKRRRVT